MLGICGDNHLWWQTFFASRETACTPATIKVWESRLMEKGFYILDTVGLKAYLEPCLLLADANYSSTSWAILEGSKQTM
jgi:hypothetical protein